MLAEWTQNKDLMCEVNDWLQHQFWENLTAEQRLCDEEPWLNVGASADKRMQHGHEWSLGVNLV